MGAIAPTCPLIDPPQLETVPPINASLAVVNDTVQSAIQLAGSLDVVVDTNHVCVNLDKVQIHQLLDSLLILIFQSNFFFIYSTKIGMKQQSNLCSFM